MGWLSASLLIVGLLIISPLTLSLGALAFVVFLLEAASFRRTIQIARYSISVVTEPRIVETIPQRHARIKSVIRNSSSLTFIVGEINRTNRSGVRSTASPSQGTIHALGRQEVSLLITCESTGKFESEATTLTLFGGRGLFKQRLGFHDSVTLISYPIARATNTLSNATVMSELSSDSLRRGIGTDLAGLRPLNFLDDFHRIDWKATARTGKMMARDLHAEKDPTIMILVDINIFELERASSDQRSNVILTQFANLFDDPFIAMSPMGLIMFDDRDVVSSLDPQIGPEGRKKLLRNLLGKLELRPYDQEPFEDISRPYQELVDDRQSLVKNLSSQERAAQIGDFLASFIGKILPYYTEATSRHFHRVRSRGEFKAFEIVTALAEPALVVCLTSQKRRFNSLLEGARMAAAMNHRVIIALVESVRDVRATRFPQDPVDSGIRTVTTHPNDLWRAINDELQVTKQGRTVQTRIVAATK